MYSTDFLSHSSAANQWQKIGIRTHHGINTPLFSLRSHNSSGIGEFLDLKMLIDWMGVIHFDILQLLPINASGNDPSPYNAVSSNALNPIYLSLYKLPRIENHPELIKNLESFKQFNLTQRVDYLNVKIAKGHFVRDYLDLERVNIFNDPSYQKFIQENTWVLPYAEFKTLKKINQGKRWEEWIDKDLQAHQDEIDHQLIVQFLCFEQMQEVRAYAEKNHIFLMGDLPILVSPDSADVWHNPSLFNLTLSAGAPPDMYNREGQKWGFPLYNYDELEKQNYGFWKERLKTADRLFHLFRIDHVVGLFRIWAIAHEKKPIEGFFIPENSAFWQPQGEKMLRMMLENSTMLPVAEDLGVIPDETRATLHRLGIPGTKVLRWERYWSGDQSFIPLLEYPVDSLTTVSTHDSEPIKLWWKNNSDEAREFAKFQGWNYEPNLSKEYLLQILYASHHTSSLLHVNLLKEYLHLFPELTGENLDDERINIPGIISPLNWTYRYKPFLEDIVSHKELTESMQAFSQP